jgi:predicted small integral membrane protein
VSARIILGPRPRKAKKRRTYANDYERKRASEPYLLATNLENDSAEAIVRIYSARMQIEEMFRDTKSPRFGWGLDYSKTRSTRRFDVLLALASLAFATVALIGAAGRERGHEPKFRARSGANVIALSVFTLGTLILSATRRIVLHIRTIWRQLEKSRRIQRDFSPQSRRHEAAARTFRCPNLTDSSASIVAGKAGLGDGRSEFVGISQRRPLTAPHGKHSDIDRFAGCGGPFRVNV